MGGAAGPAMNGLQAALARPCRVLKQKIGRAMADTTRTSCAIPRESSTSDAHCIVSQSDDDPIMIPTRACMPVVYQSLPEQLA